jgi:hypothetical protein
MHASECLCGLNACIYPDFVLMWRHRHHGKKNKKRKENDDTSKSVDIKRMCRFDGGVVNQDR